MPALVSNSMFQVREGFIKEQSTMCNHSVQHPVASNLKHLSNKCK